MVIGVANFGGQLRESWMSSLLGALEAGLDIVSGMHGRLEDVPQLKEAAQRLGRRTNPAIRCGSISFNTSRLSESEARRLLASESQRLSLPVCDPIRGGVEFEQLLDSCLR